MTTSRRTLWSLGLVIATLIAATAWPIHGWWLSHRRAALETRCRESLKSKRWDELEQLTADWCRWDANHAVAWVLAAQAAQGNRNWRRAAECLGHLPDSDPRTVPALVERMRLLFEELNQPLEAVATCERLLRIEPRASRAHSRLIFFYAMSLQRQELVRCIRRAIDVRSEPPEAYVYLFGADWLVFSNALAINTHWLESCPDYEPFLVARALHLATMVPSQQEQAANSHASQAGDLTLLNEYLQRFPDNLEVLAFHLKRTAEAGDTAGLAPLLTRAPAAAESDNRFWRYKGLYHLERTETAEAREAFGRGLATQPYDWRARHELANALRLLERPAEAERQSRLALAGKEIEQQITKLQNVAEASEELLEKIAAYAAASGDRQVADALRFRLGD